MVRALAHVGIIALVDEATGYQRERASDALATILESFIAKEFSIVFVVPIVINVRWECSWNSFKFNNKAFSTK